ncbi:TetR/AcrR family transcriptional regulator [Nocardia goodfellowii]|uniref:AcrR family transcriptional regulator n=1 Tax=Nocardia goodfellowii TaxID=882446 RepID=A0ABS4QCP3_9NOCA|nr:TetR/AcrR family transcriptional regulator [Nocardia goodfellowii]MBP2189328.1 AcrR family transcriptional regulator [Nocardia goodfellowii]
MGSKANGETKRVRLSPDERRLQLITLGVKMLGERPLEEISVSDIAEQAGISRGLLFHYFPTMQDFQLAVVAHANTELLHRVRPDSDLDLFEKLRDSIERYIDYVSENRQSYLALLRGPASASPELMSLVDQTRLAIVEMILSEMPVVVEGIERPRLVLAARGWIAFVEEITLSWLREETITRDQLVDLLVESLLTLSLALNPALAAALRG